MFPDLKFGEKSNSVTFNFVGPLLLPQIEKNVFFKGKVSKAGILNIALKPDGVPQQDAVDNSCKKTSEDESLSRRGLKII